MTIIICLLLLSLGDNLYYPPQEPIAGSQVSGGSRGDLVYDPVVKGQLTGDTYQVTFFRDPNETYPPLCREIHPARR